MLFEGIHFFYLLYPQVLVPRIYFKSLKAVSFPSAKALLCDLHANICMAN